MDHWTFTSNTNSSQPNAPNAYSHAFPKQQNPLLNNPVQVGMKPSFPTVEPPKNVSLEDVFKKKNLTPQPQPWVDPQFKNFVNHTPQSIQLPGPNAKPYPITINTKLPNGTQYWNQKYLPFPTENKPESSPSKIMSNIYPQKLPEKPTIEQLKLLQQQQQQQQLKTAPAGIFQFESVIQLEAPMVLAGNGNMYNNRPRAPPVKDDKKRKIEEPEENLYKKRFLQMASTDKQQILRPDYVTSFQTYEDVFHRLQPFYRILDLKSEEEEQGSIPDVTNIVERIEKLKEQFNKNILGKFSEETDKITLEKLFLIEEKVRLDAVKATVQKMQQQPVRMVSGTPMIFMGNPPNMVPQQPQPVKKIITPPPPKIVTPPPPVAPVQVKPIVGSMESLFKKEPVVNKAVTAPLLSFDDLENNSLEEALFGAQENTNSPHFDPSIFMLNQN